MPTALSEQRAPPQRGEAGGRRWSSPLTWLLVWATLATVARVLLSSAVMWDQAEQLVWTQSLAWGYGPQPPLYTWLQWGVNALLGPSVLALAVVKHALMVLTFVFLYAAARQIMPRSSAWLSALGIVWLPGMGWEVLRDLTHTVLVTCTVAATWWLLLRQVQRPTRGGFAWLGVVMGVGVLSKYSYVLIAGAAVLAALSLPAPRRALLGRGWWLVPLVAALLVAPHAQWVLTHWDEATRSTVDKLRPSDVAPGWSALRSGLGGFFKVFVLGALPWAAMAAWAFGVRAWTGRANAAAPSAHVDARWAPRLLLRYLLLIGAALLGMVLFAGVAKLDGRWIHPMVLVLPMAAFAWRPALGDQARGVRRYVIAVAAMGLLVWVMSLLDPLIDARRGREDRHNWPVAALEAQLRAAGYDGHSPIIASRHIAGGLLRSRFPQAPVTVCDIELWDAELCVLDAVRALRQQGTGWWMIAIEDAGPRAWWRTTVRALDFPTRPQTVRLPFRWARQGQPSLLVQYLPVTAEGGP